MVDSTRLVQFRKTAPCARPAGASPNRRMGGALLPMGGAVDFPFTPKAVFREATGAWYDPSSLWGAADHLPRRNLLTSTATLATQTKTVTAVSHTLYIKGTGSVTLSGAATGTLAGTGTDNRVSLVFTPSAGSLTLTVSGTVTEGHLTTTATADHSYQAVTDWTTELYAWAAQKNVPWLRRNFVDGTTLGSAGSWTSTRSTYNATTGLLTEDTTASATHDRRFPTLAVSAGYTYRCMFRAKYAGRHLLVSGITSGAAAYSLAVNLQTGQQFGGFSSSCTNISITEEGDGWYLCSFDSVAPTTTTVQINASLYNGTTNSYSGDGSSGAYIKDFSKMIVPVNGISTYQPIGASWEAQYAANAAAAGVVPTLYQDSAGTTPVTGPDSVVGFLGDMSQGYVLGSELVTNGDFSNGTTGWTVTGTGATLTESGGIGTLTSGSTTSAAQKTITLTVKKMYLVDITIAAGGTGTARARIDGTSLSPDLSVGTNQRVLTAAVTSSTVGITITSAAGTTVLVDSISVKELPGYHAIQSGATGLKPTLRLDSNGQWYIQRDLSDDALVTTFPNLGTSCASYINDGSTVTETTGVTLNGALTQNTPAADYGRIYLNAPSSKAAQIIKWLKAKAGLA